MSSEAAGRPARGAATQAGTAQAWAVAALSAVVWIAGGCGKPAAPAPMARPPATVTVSEPVQKEIIEWDEYPGRLEAADMVEVRSRVNGYLQSVHFKDGAEVKKGDLLFVIDPRPYEADVNRAEAEVRQAQTRLELTVNEANRAERLLTTKTISEEEADARRKAKAQAEAAVQAAQASKAMMQLNLDYTRIIAPISGRIGRKLVTEGNLVNSGQGQSTLLTTIVSQDPIYCYFDADERSILKYQQLTREGKRENLRDGKAVCELELANETGFPHKGILDFVDNRLDATTGTLRVRGVFDNPGPDRRLQPGFFARVRVPGSGKYPALLIPDLAVGTDQGQKFVLVVNRTNTVDYRPVKLGPVVDGLRVVREGLKAEDRVVVNGLMSVRPGSPVQPQRAEAKGAPTNAPAAKP